MATSTTVDTSPTDLVQQQARVQVNLTTQQQQQVRDIVAQKNVETMQPQDIAMFGSERQVAFSKSLDVLLGQITKGSSPVLFQLFKELKSAGQKADVGKLEQDIRNSLERSWWNAICDTLHLDNLVARAERLNRKIGSALVSKTTTLLDVMKKMEDGVNVEIQKLIADAGKLDILAKEFIVNGEQFGVTVEAGRAILDQANNRLLQLKSSTGNDLMKVQKAKDFESRVQLFESRVLILETAYVKSFANLDAVGLAKGASISTISETANSVLSEFTDMKTSLVTLSVSYQIQSVQAMQTARRQLRATLEKHGATVLGNVATSAAKMQGDNRLEDAQLLSALVTNLKQIGDDVEKEHKANEQKFADARTKLVEAQKTMSEINNKNNTIN